MKKQIAILVICTLILASFVGMVGAGDFGPAWLKEGAYVKYTVNEAGFVYVVNSSDPSVFDVLSFWNATFGWQCTSINDTVTKVLFTFSYTGKELNNVSLDNATLQLSGEVYVNLSTRNVYSLDGDLLGTTHLWLSASPVDGQEMVVWNIPPNRESLPAKCKDIWFLTTQGRQDGFIVEGTKEISGVPRDFLIICDYDTGVMVDGSFAWDPLINGAGITVMFLDGEIMLSDTNIPQVYPHAPHSHDENDPDSLDWDLIMFIGLPIIAFIVLFAIFYKLLSKKQKKHPTPTHHNTKGHAKNLKKPESNWHITHRQLLLNFKKTSLQGSHYLNIFKRKMQEVWFL